MDHENQENVENAVVVERTGKMVRASFPVGTDMSDVTEVHRQALEDFGLDGRTKASPSLAKNGRPFFVVASSVDPQALRGCVDSATVLITSSSESPTKTVTQALSGLSALSPLPWRFVGATTFVTGQGDYDFFRIVDANGDWVVDHIADDDAELVKRALKAIDPSLVAE